LPMAAPRCSVAPASRHWLSGGCLATQPVVASIAIGVQRNRQSLQDWSRVGAVPPVSHLRWLPGAKVEFPYGERTTHVTRSGGNRVTLPDFGVVRLTHAICQASRALPSHGGGAGACSSMTVRSGCTFRFRPSDLENWPCKEFRHFFRGQTDGFSRRAPLAGFTRSPPPSCGRW
jgi:hypothetical protein